MASLLSSVLMSVMYVLFLHHPTSDAEAEAVPVAVDDVVVHKSDVINDTECKEESNNNESTSGPTNQLRQRRANRKDTNSDNSTTKTNSTTSATTVINITTVISPKEAWYVQLLTSVRNTKFSYIIALKCVLLFIANTLSYFVAKGIQDWIGSLL